MSISFVPILLVTLSVLTACATAPRSHLTPGSQASSESPVPVVSISAERKTVFAEWTPALAACNSPLDQSVRKFTQTLPKDKAGKVIEVSAFFDFMLPANKADAKRMNGMSLLVVRIYHSRLEELPMEKIYWAPDKDRSKLFVLPPIFPKLPEFKTEGTEFASLGKYRNDGFFFFPIELLREAGEIYAVLPGGGKPVRVTRLPVLGQALPKYLKPAPKPDPKKIPEPQFIVPIILDRYCLG